MFSLSELRGLVASSQFPYLSVPASPLSSDLSSKTGVGSGSGGRASTLARLSTAGNLFTGAVARVAVGFILSPITIVKARFEVSPHQAATRLYA